MPIIGGVLSWYGTFFHELSHGLAALLTGARIQGFELNLNGSGSLSHSGSRLRVLVAFVGYPGTALAGYGIYRYLGMRPSGGLPWLWLLAGLIGLSAVLWMRDPVSWLIAACLVAILIISRRFLPARYRPHALKFIGALTLVSAFQSTWVLFGLSEKGDATTMARLLLLPEIFWVLLWIGFAGWLLWRLWRLER